MNPTLPAALIAGGGEGFGPIVNIAERLADALSAGIEPHGQMVIVCGRNQRLKRRLCARRWPVPVKVFGYVENMPQWMFASDCMITKAGPGAIAEALVCGLPLILTGFIPGQEAGNVDYVAMNGAGRYESDPRRIAAIAGRWLEPGCREPQRIAANAARLARPNATRQIVEEIASYSAARSR
jgi:1,2-diacylglycerol 3-beta-galactosyltransferase